MLLKIMKKGDSLDICLHWMLKKKEKGKADDVPDDEHLCWLIIYAVAFIFPLKNLFFLLSCNIIVRNFTH